MAIKVSLVNPRTGEKKKIKIGWSWSLFFLASFFGIELFLRRLNTLGFVSLAITLLNWLVPALPRDPDEQTSLTIAISLLMVGFNIWLAVKGNALTARNLLDLGWEFQDPQSAEATIAKKTWDLSNNHVSQASTT